MDPQRREELELEIRRRCEQGDKDGATSVALRGYGPEIFGFLVAFHHDHEDASEVFSIVSEQLWTKLDGFAWDCTFRTWAFAVARNASLNYRRDAKRRAARNAALPESSGVAALVAQVRTATLAHLRTQTKSRMAQLRETLPPEDQMLLVLRLDKGLSWNELARVLHGGGEPLDGEREKREAARLRKRFQLVKERLLELGRREGLIDGPGDDRR